MIPAEITSRAVAAAAKSLAVADGQTDADWSTAQIQTRNRYYEIARAALLAAKDTKGASYGKPQRTAKGAEVTPPIAEFLKARISEDEADARAASEERLLEISMEGRRIIYDAGFMQMFTPTRVLAECAAKRSIIREHEPVNYTGLGIDSPNACSLCGCLRVNMHDWKWKDDSFPCHTLKALAAIYKDHPDYRQEWAK